MEKGDNSSEMTHTVWVGARRRWVHSISDPCWLAADGVLQTQSRVSLETNPPPPPLPPSPLLFKRGTIQPHVTWAWKGVSWKDRRHPSKTQTSHDNQFVATTCHLSSSSSAHHCGDVGVWRRSSVRGNVLVMVEKISWWLSGLSFADSGSVDFSL